MDHNDANNARENGHVGGLQLSKERLRLTEFELLNNQLDFVVENSLFYRKKFGARKAGSIRLSSLDELQELPFTTKEEVRECIELVPPLGSHLCVPPEKIIQIQASSGTTGRPSYIAYTKKDLDVICDMQARCFRSAGFLPGDVTLHAFAMSRGYAGGLPMVQAAMFMGCTVLPIGSETGVEKLLRIIADQRPVAIYGPPSFIEYLGSQAEAVLGLPARDLSIRKILVGSEPGGGLPETRRRLQDIWGARSREMYGLSDLGLGFWAEGESTDGMDFHGQGYLLVELIDPSTGKIIPATAGAKGELVYTSLQHEAMPLVRFRSRDLVEIRASDENLPLPGTRIKVLGRTDDMLICRGINVYPGAVQDVINGFKPETTGRFRIVLNFAGHSTNEPLPLHVEVVPGADDSLAERVEETIRSVLSFKARVTLVPDGYYGPLSTAKPVLIERKQ